MSPQVSIGLPVYNGTNFVAQAIDCILNQTFRDFELIITDNASTDATESICRDYAARDARIRYVRNRENLGAADNFNLAYRLSVGRYFKWAAHDDLCAPQFVERCLEALEAHPSAVLAFPQISFVRPDGLDCIRKQLHPDLNLLDPSPASRTRRLVTFQLQDESVFWSIFGLIRRAALERTKLIQKFDASDQVLLYELLLLGGFVQVPEEMFYRREHQESYSKRLDRSASERLAWFFPNHRTRLLFPTFRLMGEHLRAVQLSPMSLVGRLGCAVSLLWRFAHSYRYMCGDLVDAAKSLWPR